jgi:hypothetical protein
MRLFGVGEGDVCAQADHSETGSNALTAAEGGARFEFAFDGNSQADDEKIGGGIEGDGERAKNRKLEEYVAVLGRDELRDEGEKEESGFGIEDFGENALAKSAMRWGKSARGKLGIARADHADAEKNEINGACEFDGVKSNSGGGENGGDACGGGENVNEAAKESAASGENAFAATTGEAASENIENTRAGSDCEDQSSKEERKEVMGVKHGDSLRGGSGRRQ